MSKSLSAAIAVLFVAPLAQAAVNDVYPADYYPLDPGTQLFTLYSADRDVQLPHNNTLHMQTLAMRGSYMTELWGKTANVMVVLPWVKSSLELANGVEYQQNSAIADLRLGATIWPINDKIAERYLGLTATIIPPTGSYDKHRLLNAGENRWRALLTLGWQQTLAPKWVFELSQELAWYGDNTHHSSGLRYQQAATYAATSYLRYRAHADWHVHLGGQINRGGRISLGGQRQTQTSFQDRVTVGVTWIDPLKQQWILRVGRDVNNKNTSKTDHEIALRFLKAF